jgi:uncharacterized delta-60 repeat protein
LVIFAITLITSRQASGQAGQLDPTFGDGGIVTTDFGNTTGNNVATANAAAIQPDGKILVAGGAPASNGFPTAVVARYNTNGSLDTGFGNAGIEVTRNAPVLSAIALQANGKIVATGAAGIDVDVVRYNSNGSLDGTFGTGGIASFEAIGIATSGAVVQPDGKIVVGNGKFLIRFLSNGQPDSTFGSGGSAKTAGLNPSSLTALSDGKLLVAFAFDNSGVELSNFGSVGRYNSNGSLDTSFGINGQMATAGPANGLVLLNTGEFVVGGSLISNPAELNQGFQPFTGFAVSRYKGGGVADARFGVHAGVFTPLANYANVLTAGIGVQSTGDIVALGSAANVFPLAFALTRCTPTGQLDTTFETDGIVITSFGSNTLAAANGIAIQSDDKIVAVGSYSTTGSNFDTAFKITRYLGN